MNKKLRYKIQCLVALVALIFLVIYAAINFTNPQYWGSGIALSNFIIGIGFAVFGYFSIIRFEAFNNIKEGVKA